MKFAKFTCLVLGLLFGITKPIWAAGFGWHVYSVAWSVFSEIAQGTVSSEDKSRALRQFSKISDGIPEEYVLPAKGIITGGLRSIDAQKVSACSLNYISFFTLIPEKSIFPKLRFVNETSDGISHEFVSVGIKYLENSNESMLKLFQLGRNYERSEANVQCYKSARDETANVNRRECACDFGPDPSYVALSPTEVQKLRAEVLVLLAKPVESMKKSSVTAVAALQDLLVVLNRVAGQQNRGLIFGTNN
jgi:hypothetical protein